MALPFPTYSVALDWEYWPMLNFVINVATGHIKKQSDHLVGKPTATNFTVCFPFNKKPRIKYRQEMCPWEELWDDYEIQKQTDCPTALNVVDIRHH